MGRSSKSPRQGGCPCSHAGTGVQGRPAPAGQLLDRTCSCKTVRKVLYARPANTCATCSCKALLCSEQAAFPRTPAGPQHQHALSLPLVEVLHFLHLLLCPRAHSQEARAQVTQHNSPVQDASLVKAQARLTGRHLAHTLQRHQTVGAQLSTLTPGVFPVWGEEGAPKPLSPLNKGSDSNQDRHCLHCRLAACHLQSCLPTTCCINIASSAH